MVDEPALEDTWQSPDEVPAPGWIVVHRNGEPVWEEVSLPPGPVAIADGRRSVAHFALVGDRLQLVKGLGHVSCGTPRSSGLWSHAYARVGQMVVLMADDVRRVTGPPVVDHGVVLNGEARLMCDRFDENRRAALLVGARATGKRTIARVLAARVGGRYEWLDAYELRGVSEDDQYRATRAAFDRSEGAILIVDSVECLAPSPLRLLSHIAKAITDRNSDRWRAVITMATASTIALERVWFGRELVLSSVHQRRSDIPTLVATFAREVHPLMRVSAAAVAKCLAYPWDAELCGLRKAVRRAGRRALSERSGTIEELDFDLYPTPYGLDSFGSDNDA